MVYPNPSEGLISIRNNNIGLSVYKIYNVKGLLICKDEFVDATTINIADQPAGVYLLKIISGEDECSKIIVKL